MKFFGLFKGLKEMELPGLKEIKFYEGFFSDFYEKYVTHDFDIFVFRFSKE